MRIYFISEIGGFLSSFELQSCFGLSGWNSLPLKCSDGHHGEHSNKDQEKHEVLIFSFVEIDLSSKESHQNETRQE